MNQDAHWAPIREREAAFDKIVAPVHEAAAAHLAARLGNIKVWSAHFGATGIDPKHLFVYFVLPRRDDVATLTASPAWGSIERGMRQELETAGYPVAALQADWLACVSQQACDEEYAGNWYHFFK